MLVERRESCRRVLRQIELGARVAVQHTAAERTGQYGRHRLPIDEPAAQAQRLHLPGDGTDPMVGREDQRVAVPSHLPVEFVEQRADGPVEPHEDVLYLVAARTVGMADGVERRETHRQEVRALPASEPEVRDGGRRHAAQKGIREGAHLPVGVERLIDLADLGRSELLGGGRIVTLSLLIYQQFNLTQDAAFAGAMGTVLLVLAFICLVAQTWLLRSRRFEA